MAINGITVIDMPPSKEEDYAILERLAQHRKAEDYVDSICNPEKVKHGPKQKLRPADRHSA